MCREALSKGTREEIIVQIYVVGEHYWVVHIQCFLARQQGRHYALFYYSKLVRKKAGEHL